MLKLGDKIIIKTRRGVLMNSPMEITAIATVVRVGKVWAKLDRPAYGNFPGSPSSYHWPVDHGTAATEEELREAREFLAEKDRARKEENLARRESEQREDVVLRRFALGAIEHEDVPVEKLRRIKKVLDDPQLDGVEHDELQEVLAELLHLGAEFEDINGEARQSKACNIVRRAIERAKERG